MIKKSDPGFSFYKEDIMVKLDPRRNNDLNMFVHLNATNVIILQWRKISQSDCTYDNYSLIYLPTGTRHFLITTKIKTIRKTFATLDDEMLWIIMVHTRWKGNGKIISMDKFEEIIT